MDNNQILQVCDAGDLISLETLPLSSGVNIEPVGTNESVVTTLNIVIAEKKLDDIPIYISSNCSDIKKYIDCGIQPINCEIKEAKIHETYTLMDKSPFNKNFPIETEFHTIKENIIVDLSITLFQEQDVTVNYKNNPH